MELKKVFINGREWLFCDKETLSYDGIVAFANVDEYEHRHEIVRDNYTVTYSARLGDDLVKKGILSKGESVTLVDGMIINCSRL